MKKNSKTKVLPKKAAKNVSSSGNVGSAGKTSSAGKSGNVGNAGNVARPIASNGTSGSSGLFTKK